MRGVKKSDSRKARLSTAKLVNAFASKEEQKSKIKSTPPQSSPALRAREEAETEAMQEQIKIKADQDQDQDQDQDR